MARSSEGDEGHVAYVRFEVELAQLFSYLFVKGRPHSYFDLGSILEIRSG